MPQKMINNEKMPDKLYEAIAYMKEHLADSPSFDFLFVQTFYHSSVYAIFDFYIE